MHKIEFYEDNKRRERSIKLYYEIEKQEGQR